MTQSAMRRLESCERGIELVEPGNNRLAAISFALAAKLRNGPAFEERGELVERVFLLIPLVLGLPLIARALVICMFRSWRPVDSTVALNIVDPFLNTVLRYEVAELIAKLFGSIIWTTPNVEIAASSLL
jgi:hypothetical protein